MFISLTLVLLGDSTGKVWNVTVTKGSQILDGKTRSINYHPKNPLSPFNSSFSILFVFSKWHNALYTANPQTLLILVLYFSFC